MTTTRRPVEPKQTTARPVLAIEIDIGQLIEAVRRHVPLNSMAARAIRRDFAALFDTSRVTVVTSAPTRKTKAAAKTPNRPSKRTP